MTSPFRILEILTCSLVSFLPYLMLVTYPFRNDLRGIGFLTSLAAILQMGCDLAIGLGLVADAALVRIIVISIHFLLSLILIRAPFGKKIFALLTTVNAAVALSMAAKYLEGMLFPAQSLDYHWTYLVLLLALQALILLPFALLMMRRQVRISGGHIAPWGILWLVPAAVIAITVYMNFNGLLGLNVDLVTIGLTVFSCLITLPFIRKPKEETAEEVLEEAPAIQPELAALFSDGSAAEEAPAVPAEAAPAAEGASVIQEEAPAPQSLPKPAEKKILLQNQETKKLPILRSSKELPLPVRMQAQQYDHLQARMSQSNQFHRELRRHVDALAYRLEKKQYDKLEKHLTSLQQQLSGEDDARFCENSTANAILSYFCQMAGYSGVKVTTDVHLPADLSISAEDLSVLMGNLLDNALDACKKQCGTDRRIFISGWTDSKALYMTVENTYEGAVQKDAKGNYISDKHPGCSMGLEVCKAIVSRHSGKMEITDSNGIFKVNVTLKN